MELLFDKMELGGVIASAVFLAGAAFRAGWLAMDRVAEIFALEEAEAPIRVSRRVEIETGRRAVRELSA